MIQVSVSLVLIATFLTPVLGTLDPPAISPPAAGDSINDDADPVGVQAPDPADSGKSNRQGDGNGGSSRPS